MGDVIWVDADDYSFMAMLKVTFVSGTELKCKLIMFKEMDVVNISEEEANSTYFIKMMGTNKWCIVHRATGDVKIKMIPTKLEAHKQLDDYTRALAA